MSFTIVTDVFCNYCSMWMGEGGPSSFRPERKLANQWAKERGWEVKNNKHRCPDCCKKKAKAIRAIRGRREGTSNES